MVGKKPAVRTFIYVIEWVYTMATSIGQIVYKFFSVPAS